MAAAGADDEHASTLAATRSVGRHDGVEALDGGDVWLVGSEALQNWLAGWFKAEQGGLVGFRRSNLQLPVDERGRLVARKKLTMPTMPCDSLSKRVSGNIYT